MEMLCYLVMILLPVFHPSAAEFLAAPVNMVPAVPSATVAQICKLDLSDELFGGVKVACEKNLDRSRCCPVLAAWLFAAHARAALTISPQSPDSPADLPIRPDDSQRCVSSLQEALTNRSIHIPQTNGSCDPVLCYCGIRLHTIGSLNCPAAFTVNSSASGHTATPAASVRNLERNCRNSSTAGCTRCFGALLKLKPANRSEPTTERARKMMDRDCQLMGLTWLLARNKTAYIPTVSAVLRAVLYSPRPSPHESICSPEQENMPLAVDSLELENAESLSSPPTSPAAWAATATAALVIHLAVPGPFRP